MSNPILCIHHAIQLSALNVDVLVLFIEIGVMYSSSGVCKLIGNGYGREKGRNNKVDILAWVWEETKHAEEREGCHATGIVVAWKSGGCGVES